jgi:hypothetical protein
MATTVALSPAVEQPRSRPVPISSKREFEQIISLICRKFAESRSIASQNLEILQLRSQNDSDNQWKHHLAGNLGQIGISALGLRKVINSSDPKQFELYSKFGDVFKNTLDAFQISDQKKKEQIQHANTQWQTYANGLQETIRNLKAGQQRLQQMEDSSHR